MSLEQKRKAFMNVLNELDYDMGVTIGSYVGELEEPIYQDPRQSVLEGLYEENKRYCEAVGKIKEKYTFFEDVPSSLSTGLSMAIEILEEALED